MLSVGDVFCEVQGREVGEGAQARTSGPNGFVRCTEGVSRLNRRRRRPGRPAGGIARDHLLKAPALKALPRTGLAAFETAGAADEVVLGEDFADEETGAALKVVVVVVVVGEVVVVEVLKATVVVEITEEEATVVDEAVVDETVEDETAELDAFGSGSCPTRITPVAALAPVLTTEPSTWQMAKTIGAWKKLFSRSEPGVVYWS